MKKRFTEDIMFSAGIRFMLGIIIGIFIIFIGYFLFYFNAITDLLSTKLLVPTGGFVLVCGILAVTVWPKIFKR